MVPFRAVIEGVIPAASAHDAKKIVYESLESFVGGGKVPGAQEMIVSTRQNGIHAGATNNRAHAIQVGASKKKAKKAKKAKKVESADAPSQVSHGLRRPPKNGGTKWSTKKREDINWDAIVLAYQRPDVVVSKLLKANKIVGSMLYKELRRRGIVTGPKRSGQGAQN
jgi:hypothetical protein